MYLVRQERDTGEYRGKDFQGNACEGTLQLGADRGSIYIKCSHGYAGSYSGKRSGNVIEGEYSPSTGFGPRDYFKATW